MIDLVIRNGTVVDGSGRPRYRADVGVRDGRITSIGRITERATAEIDAEGRFVSPGFVEVHTHMDAQVFWDSLGTCSSWHGVTTSVMGNCGFTLAPCAEADKDLVMRSLERAEDISREAMLAGIPWQWETFPEYLDAVERTPKGINYAGYLGHSALRTFVMGERAFEEPASDHDVAAMGWHLEEAVRAGAIGLSTSRTPNHQTSDDRPVPSRQADWSEVRSLVTRMGDLGAGIFEIANEQHADPGAKRDYYDRLRDLAVESGRPVTFILGWSAAAPATTREYLDLLDETAVRGGRMFAQGHSREFMSVIGFPVHLPYDTLPSWRALRLLPLDAQRKVLSDPVQRARLVQEATDGPYRTPVGAEARPPDYDVLRVLDTPDGPTRTVAEVAADRGVAPIDALIDLSLEGGFDRFFGHPFANQDMGEVLRILEDPRVVVGGSDSGAHVSQVIDSSIPTFLLAHWVRGQQAFTWEEGIRKLTFDPAMAFGFSDRGLVAEGMAADLVVFDPATVAPGLPHAATDLPAGASRLVQKAVGIDATVVNGEVLLRHGEPTGALPGSLLRGPLAGAR
jgi:N-acyl-D-aspartate/D-glutamate deacylase